MYKILTVCQGNYLTVVSLKLSQKNPVLGLWELKETSTPTPIQCLIIMKKKYLMDDIYEDLILLFSSQGASEYLLTTSHLS